MQGGGDTSRSGEWIAPRSSRWRDQTTAWHQAQVSNSPTATSLARRSNRSRPTEPHPMAHPSQAPRRTSRPGPSPPPSPHDPAGSRRPRFSGAGYRSCGPPLARSVIAEQARSAGLAAPTQPAHLGSTDGTTTRFPSTRSSRPTRPRPSRSSPRGSLRPLRRTRPTGAIRCSPPRPRARSATVHH